MHDDIPSLRVSGKRQLPICTITVTVMYHSLLGTVNWKVKYENGEQGKERGGALLCLRSLIPQIPTGDVLLASLRMLPTGLSCFFKNATN